MQGIRSKVFTTGLIAVMAMVALVAALFAVQPAYAGELAAGTVLGTQSKTPQISVVKSATVQVAKSITITATDTVEGQTGTWVWEVIKGTNKVELKNTTTPTVTVTGMKGGDAKLKVRFITDSGVQGYQTVAIQVSGIKSKITTASGIIFKRINADEVVLQGTADNKDLGLKKINVPKYVKLGDGDYKASYKVAGLNRYSLNDQTKTSSIIVGDNVRTIGQNALSGDASLVKLTIGTGVTTLGKAMINQGTSKLQVITIKSTKLTKDGVKACFKGNKSVKKLKVPASKVADYQKIFTKEICGANVKVVAL